MTHTKRKALGTIAELKAKRKLPKIVGGLRIRFLNYTPPPQTYVTEPLVKRVGNTINIRAIGRAELFQVNGNEMIIDLKQDCRHKCIHFGVERGIPFVRSIGVKDLHAYKVGGRKALLDILRPPLVAHLARQGWRVRRQRRLYIVTLPQCSWDLFEQLCPLFREKPEKRLNFSGLLWMTNSILTGTLRDFGAEAGCIVEGTLQTPGYPETQLKGLHYVDVMRAQICSRRE